MTPPTYLITEVKYHNILKSWRIELEHGLIVQLVKMKPSYKEGDTIVSLTHFYEYCEALNRFTK